MAERELKKSEIFKRLHKKADKGESLCDADWQELNALVIKTLPNFHQFIAANEYALNQNEY